MPPVHFIPTSCKTILNRVKAPAMPFDWSINPYRGCQHGCSFCYARSTHAFLGAEADDTFQKRIFIKANGPKVLGEQLEKLLRSAKGRKGFGFVAIGTATDPYQPIEAQAKITRGCLEVLAKYQIPTSITTRSPLILRDLDLLKQLPLKSVNISVHTLDPKIWKNFEPSTPSPLHRLETVQKLREENLPAGIFMAPILPFLTDGTEDMEKLIAMAAACGAQFVMASFLRLSTPEVKDWFFQTLARHYPRLLPKYREMYARSSTVPLSYRERVLQTVEQLRKRHGIHETSPETRPSPQKEDRQESEWREPVQLSFTFSL